MRTLADRPSKKANTDKQETSAQTEPSSAPQPETQSFDESVNIDLG